MNARAIFDSVFGQPFQNRWESFLDLEHKRLVELYASEEVSEQERIMIWEDIKGVLRAKRELHSGAPMGRCLSCASFGQLKNGLCSSCWEAETR